MTHHLVGAAEVAALLGVSRQRVSQLSAAQDFPVPQAELASGRIWARDEVEEWIRARGRQREMPMVPELTPQERQVLECVAGGSSVPELARALAISERTGRNHLRNIAAKLTALSDDGEEDSS
ncbi:MAG TPA: LuxR C-terminal-related transcriptional regulator [Acidimicrobiales bacterium]|nr:LuxR C-terminal-related transcriptional regulator [Acidimicrobiales bacterium]